MSNSPLASLQEDRIQSTILYLIFDKSFDQRATVCSSFLVHHEYGGYDLKSEKPTLTPKATPGRGETGRMGIDMKKLHMSRIEMPKAFSQQPLIANSVEI